MLRSNVKFNHAHFEYFVLQVGQKNDREQIKSKLIDFTRLDHADGVIMLAFDDDVEFENIGQIVPLVVELAREVGVKIHAILRSDALGVEVNIADIPVIDLPKSEKSQHIYSPTLLYNEPVRSGIRVENDGDIIVTNFVSDNAEIVASGNIHIYGVARGRLMAGNGGDKSKRIFVSHFNAQLISIGGIFRVIESKLPINVLHKAVMIGLDSKDHLTVTLL